MAARRKSLLPTLRRALSPTFRAGSDAAHYPLAGVGAADFGAVLLDRREPPIFLFSKFRCGPIDGAHSCSQLPGLCTSAPAASERAGGLCVVLSLRHFGPAAMLLIIPWQGWAPRIWRGELE